VIQKSDIRRISYDDAAEQERLRREQLKRQQAEEARRKAEEERRLAEEAAQKAAEEAEQEKREAERQKQESLEEERRKEEARRQAEAREAQEAAHRSSGPHRFEAFFRSMLLPGWGQFYQGRTSAAYGFGGAFLGGLGVAYITDRRYYTRRAAYEDKADQFFYTSPLVLSSLGSSISSPTTLAPLGLLIAGDTVDARNRMQNAGRWANRARTLLLGLYVWNLVDVLVFHPTPTESVGVSLGPDQVGFRYSLRF
jgi:hypothetical protein